MKCIFVALAADAIKDVSKEEDENGWKYERKSMIWWGFAMQLSGLWEVYLINSHVHNIIKKYRVNFDGASPDASPDLPSKQQKRIAFRLQAHILQMT